MDSYTAMRLAMGNQALPMERICSSPEDIHPWDEPFMLFLVGRRVLDRFMLSWDELRRVVEE